MFSYMADYPMPDLTPMIRKGVMALTGTKITPLGNDAAKALDDVLSRGGASGDTAQLGGKRFVYDRKTGQVKREDTEPTS